MTLIRSISGLRATLGDSLTPELITRYSKALHLTLANGTIVIGNDGRPSGEWICELLSENLSSFGRNVITLETVPTPTVQLIVEHSDAIAGIAVTASHNPENWNGLKFINSSGVFFGQSENEILWDTLDNGDLTIKYNSTGFIEKSFSAIDEHINKILNLKFFTNEIFSSLNSLKLKIVVDAVNASGSIIVPKLLGKLNCEVIELFCNSSGIFPHTPEPLTENLKDLSDAVKFHKADLGIAVDPDADRLVLIDENGLAIGEEKTIVLACLSVLINRKSEIKNNIVVNFSTTSLVEFIASEYNCGVIRSPVGEINVVNKMKECSAIIGGEGSGGVILPECHYGRDSLVGIALILSLVAKAKKPLSLLVSELPDYSMLKFKKEYSGNFSELSSKIKTAFTDYSINEEDGIRAVLNDSWFQIRKSNTEPIIRIIVESESLGNSQKILDRVLSIVS